MATSAGLEIQSEIDNIANSTFWGEHKTLYLSKYIILSLISTVSKILDIVLFWNYGIFVICTTFLLGPDGTGPIDECAPLAQNLETIQFMRFFATFAFGIVSGIAFITWGFWYACKNHEGPMLACLTILCLGPVMVFTKIIVIITRFVSIIYFKRDLDKHKDLSYIPDELQIYWGAQISIPETLISGPFLLAITICELAIPSDLSIVFTTSGIV